MHGSGWGFSLYGEPAKKDCQAVMRIYSNGTGIPFAKLRERFGEPRKKEEDVAEFTHAIWGNVDVIYDKTGKYIGTVFVFEPVRESTK